MVVPATLKLLLPVISLITVKVSPIETVESATTPPTSFESPTTLKLLLPVTSPLTDNVSPKVTASVMSNVPLKYELPVAYKPSDAVRCNDCVKDPLMYRWYMLNPLDAVICVS